MNAPNVRNMRPVETFDRVTFKAWRAGKEQPIGYPIEVVASSLGEAIQQAAVQCQHKDVFHVLQIDTLTGEQLLVTCAVKQAKPVWRKCPQTMIAKQFRDLYADEIVRMKVTDFAPVEPFRWAAGCDVVGARDAGVIEHRMHGPEAF